MNPLLLAFLLTSACTSHFVGFYVVGPGDKPRCIHSNNASGEQKKYASLNECHASAEYEEKEIKYARYYIYSKDGYDDSSTQKVLSYYCSSMDSERLRKPINPNESFGTFEECNRSESLKGHHNEINKRLETARENNRNKKLQVEGKRVSKIKEFVEKNSQYKSFMKTAVEQKISMGMPEELVVLSWGKPQRVNTTVTKRRVHKQMVYGRRNYVYLDNGVVTSWQN